MKTQKLKFLMPVIAIVFAITTSAFTSAENSKVDENFTTMTGYTANSIPGQPCQSVIVDCDITGNFLCTVNGKPVYRFLSGTSCVSNLRRSQ